TRRQSIRRGSSSSPAGSRTAPAPARTTTDPRGDTDMKARALTIAGLAALALALVVPAAGIAGTPTVISVKASSAGSFSICGLDLTYDFKTSGIEMIRPDGADLSSGEFRTVWTNPATGLGIVIHGAQHGDSGASVDNGDGTVSVIQTSDGLYKVSA